MSTEDRPTSDAENDKDKDKHNFSDDPPIIVGGGGSTRIWIRKNTTPKLIEPPAAIPGVPPKNPGNYYVFDCNKDVKNIDSKDGKGGGSTHINIDKDKHRTAFDE